MTENYQKKYIFYGIVLFFFVKLLVGIVNSILSFIIGYLNFNILFIPLLSILFCALVLFIVFRRKTFPQIKPWFFVIVVLVSMCVNFFSTGEYIEHYTLAERGMNYSFMKGIDFLFMLVFSIIAYLKYYRIKEKSN